MKILSYCKDGGPESTVSGFFFVEIKSWFSVVLLVFQNGSRPAYHSHAFNCYSWLLKGTLVERLLKGKTNVYTPSIFGFPTYRSTFHQVESLGKSYVLSFRGPWAKDWKEYVPEEQKYVTLTHGRVVKDDGEMV